MTQQTIGEQCKLINDDIPRPESKPPLPEGFKFAPTRLKNGFLNRKAVKIAALQLMNELWPPEKGCPPRFNKISRFFIDELEKTVQAQLYYALKRHPAPGINNIIKFFTK